MARLNMVSGNSIRCEYDSTDELAAVAQEHLLERYPEGMDETLGYERFYGDAKTVGDAFRMAREGWTAHLDETLDIASSAVETVEAERRDITFQPHWDVAGGMVDMGAYLAGEPECMIDFPPVPATKAGRVVTICASGSVSAGISADQLILKGQVTTALALELERLGMNTELYADISAERKGYALTQRVLVKSANDVLDPARILYAFAHPTMLRVLALTAMHDLPAVWRKRMDTGGGYGSPAPCPEDLPEGTLYLPETMYGAANAAPDYLKSYLTELGIL